MASSKTEAGNSGRRSERSPMARYCSPAVIRVCRDQIKVSLSDCLALYSDIYTFVLRGSDPEHTICSPESVSVPVVITTVMR